MRSCPESIVVVSSGRSCVVIAARLPYTISVEVVPLENETVLSERIDCDVDERTCTSWLPESNEEMLEVAPSVSAEAFTSLATRMSRGSASGTATRERMLVEFWLCDPLHPETSARAATT